MGLSYQTYIFKVLFIILMSGVMWALELVLISKKSTILSFGKAGVHGSLPTLQPVSVLRQVCRTISLPIMLCL